MKPVRPEKEQRKRFLDAPRLFKVVTASFYEVLIFSLLGRML